MVLLTIGVACTTEQKPATLSNEEFAYDYNGKKIELYTIKNENGLIAQFTNFGARLASLYAPDKDGKLGDVVVGYESGKAYVDKKDNYYGAIIGRYGNRIGNATFTLDSVVYELEKNDGENHLHGGSIGFHRVIWDVKSVGENSIVFNHVSDDMTDGYPGKVDVTVTYTLTDQNELKIEYAATTDKKTILNLTNHTYFNLKDAGASTINNHVMQINANAITPVDGGLIPTGELADVTGTPFDFRKPTVIGERVDAEDEQLALGHGYDHNWVLNTNGDVSKRAAKVLDPSSGRTLEVYTNEPGLQFYGGNFLDGKISGKYGIMIAYRGAFCLETQHFPDSPNKPEFPSVVLEPGQEYNSVCIYKFGVE